MEVFPLHIADFAVRDHLFVGYPAFVVPPKNINAGTVAQANVESAPAKQLQPGLSGWINPGHVAGNLQLAGDQSVHQIVDQRHHQTDQVIHLALTYKQQALLDELIRRLLVLD
ncbi:hypothetical protein D3C71_1659220 [compost metagenome]